MRPTTRASADAGRPRRGSSPTERAIEALPERLRRWVVPQDYGAYGPVEQETWRRVMARLGEALRGRAHPLYQAGLEATGIRADRIPSLDEMNVKLERIGWTAVGVSGFVPPAVFTELQSRRVLAIATAIRRPEHLDYTPAPDIVHESAGHAPFLADPRYADYLQRCGEAGFRAIPAAEDQAVFQAVRTLSEVAEHGGAAGEAAAAEASLAAARAAVSHASEGARASRLYWWTAEYGLVGALEAPRLYGAGLLSSIGEASRCLGPEVERVALGPGCTEVAFDITRMQPQLFVALDFGQLFEVLEAFAATLAFRRGGDHGLAVALRARTVVELSLEGGGVLCGRVVAVEPSPRPVAQGLSAALVRLGAPVRLVPPGRPSSPDDAAPWADRPGLVAFGPGGLAGLGPQVLTFPSGLRLSLRHLGGGEAAELRGWLEGRPLELPERAVLAVSGGLPSVSAGPDA